MKIRTAPLAAASIGVALAAGLLLSACSASVSIGNTTPTITGASLASQAADALQKSVGSATAPDIDCGTTDIPVTEGKVVDCVFHNPDDSKDYATTVTMSAVDGSKFHLDVKVASTPS